MKFGYYWIKFKDSKEEIIGYYGDDFKGEYNEEEYLDGSGKGRVFTWQIVGSDEIYKNKEIDVLREVK